MEVFGQFSYQRSSSLCIERQETSSLSDSSSGGGPTSSSVHSDPEVLLATSRPKKRAGRRIFKETRHPVFRGVRRRNGNKWVCELREPKKTSRIWLGTYPTPEMAARAHDVAALALRGKSACLNFADSRWRLPVPASTDAGEIRKAAIEAAELFRPQEFGGKAEREKEAVEDLSQVCSDGCMNRKKNELTFMDEEAEFDMPRLLTDMAAGLLLSPPHYFGGSTGWDDDDESHSDFSLWSY